MVSLFDAYRGKEDKYRRPRKNNFEKKVSCILESCEQADLIDEHWDCIISIMIIGHARQVSLTFSN